jgi:hypothetical protein
MAGTLILVNNGFATRQYKPHPIRKANNKLVAIDVLVERSVTIDEEVLLPRMSCKKDVFVRRKDTDLSRTVKRSTDKAAQKTLMVESHFVFNIIILHSIKTLNEICL